MLEEPRLLLLLEGYFEGFHQDFSCHNFSHFHSECDFYFVGWLYEVFRLRVLEN